MRANRPFAALLTFLASLTFLVTAAAPAANAQTTPSFPGQIPGSQYRIIPAVPVALSPGVIALVQLEGRFADDVAAGGGKAFGTWFADDAVILNNGQPAIRGRGAIAAQASWDPKSYQLTWAVEGAQMSPLNDMGYTWGRYVGHTTDSKGQVSLTTGRYLTIWRKDAAGAWKVVLDASADAPPASPAATP